MWKHLSPSPARKFKAKPSIRNIKTIFRKDKIELSWIIYTAASMKLLSVFLVHLRGYGKPFVAKVPSCAPKGIYFWVILPGLIVRKKIVTGWKVMKQTSLRTGI
jgi:hypothetical protein